MGWSPTALRRRCRWTQRCALLVCLVVVLMLGAHHQLWQRQQMLGHPSCMVTQEQRRRLYPLLSQVSTILSRLAITHFLCYDSLWGAVQESGPLPWDANGHLCALNEGVALHDEAELLRAFRRHDLTLEYSSAEGQYTIKNTSGLVHTKDGPNVRVVLFEDDDRVHMVRRVGWRRRLLPPDCDAHPSLECFPPNLVRLPLPRRPFGPLSLPAPREDMDLLKYHYPETWWRPLQPRC